MDILNVLPEPTFAALDDLLTFISIYDDRRRTRAYLRLLRSHRRHITGAVCVDAGCGMGYFAEEMVRLGARRVYAVEANPHLFALASERLAAYPEVVCVRQEIQHFEPDEPVDVLVHEFFGPLLYDEDVHVLEALRFRPRLVLPDRAVLMGGLTWVEQVADETVTPAVVRRLEGALVSGLFDEGDLALQFPVVHWTFGQAEREVICDLSGREGDLLYLGLQIYHGDRLICQAGRCANWPYVWTPRAGDRFRLQFVPNLRGAAVYFSWG
jgi:SAM-dependent methyltransferase